MICFAAEMILRFPLLCPLPLLRPPRPPPPPPLSSLLCPMSSLYPHIKNHQWRDLEVESVARWSPRRRSAPTLGVGETARCIAVRSNLNLVVMITDFHHVVRQLAYDSRQATKNLKY